MKHLNSSWETRRYPRPKRNELTRLARRAAELAGLPADFDWDLDIRFVGDRTMAQANAEFVGHEGTTDVITFSYFDDPGSLFPGEAAVELLICLDAARREGEKRADSSYSREVVLYIVPLRAAGCAAGNAKCWPGWNRSSTSPPSFPRRDFAADRSGQRQNPRSLLFRSES